MIKKYKSRYVGRSKKEPEDSGDSETTEKMPTVKMTKRELDEFHKKYDYDEPAANIKIVPEKKNRVEQFASDHPWLAKAGAAVKKRSADVARDLQRPNSYRKVSPSSGIDAPDPFGMGVAHRNAGNIFGSGGPVHNPFNQPNPFDRPNPFHGPQRRDSPAPRVSGASTRTIYHPDGRVEVIHAGSSKKKRRTPKEPRNNFADPFHIPKSMKHLF